MPNITVPNVTVGGTFSLLNWTPFGASPGFRGWIAIALSLGSGLMSCGLPATAQTPLTDPANPSSDFLQPTPLPSPVAPEEEVPLSPPDSPEPSPTPPFASPQVLVRQIAVLDSTVFTAEEFAELTAPYLGQTLSLEQLRQVADAITQRYLDQGYITSRAILVDQLITDGVVQIRVIEGTVAAIDVQGNRRVNAGYIRQRIALGSATPLNQQRLEDQLRLLRLDPLFENVEASLQAGDGLGQSILTVRVTEADPWIAAASLDNFSPPSVGSERTGVVLGYRNLTGNGDALLGAYYRSTTGGSNVFDFSYTLPLNPREGTLQLRVAPSNYRITDPAFAALEIEGNANLYEVSLRQPILRSPRQELGLSLGLSYRDGDTFVNEFQVDDTTTSVLKVGQDYVRRDPEGAWALRSQFNIGTGLFDATTTGVADGLFVSWLGQVQRVQVLHPDHLLIIQTDLQLATEPLPGAQQFVIGGGQSIRGYRQNALIGDNGLRVSIEDRITLQRDEAGATVLQLTPFLDLGTVWNDRANPTDLSDFVDQTLLVGVGVGLIWEPLQDLLVRVDYGASLTEFEAAGENAQDHGLYFSVNYRH